MDPTSGDAWVAGHSILSEGERIKEKIGYMSQRFGLYEDLTVMENILFYADLYDVPQQERQRPARSSGLLGFSNLTPFKDRLAGQLSGGMKQKLGLACALIHTPEVLFLDEPTNGVDPVSRRDFWKILYDLLREGVTIFVSTAYLDEAERCTRIGLMHKGEILIEDEPKTVEEFPRRTHDGGMVGQARAAALRLSGPWTASAASAFTGTGCTSALRKNDDGAVISELAREGVDVKDFREILPSLEDVFISMVEK